MSDRIETLQNTLPTPLAQLVKRLAAAATSRDRHDAAFYLGEASLKLAASVRVGRLLSLSLPLTPALAKKLEGLMLPSTGHWMALLRETSHALREHDPADVLADTPALTRARKDFTGVAAFAKAMEGAEIGSRESLSQAAKGGIFGFFTLLVVYRNKVIGHSGQRVPTFYADMADALSEALAEVLAVPELFGGLDLVVPRHELGSGTAAATRLRVLRGLGASTRPADGAGWTPGELYLAGTTGYRAPLSPLVVFAESNDQQERFGFLNGVDARDREVIKRVEYLDYTTSTTVAGVDTIPKLATLLSRIRGGEQVGAGDVKATMARLAEQAPTEPAAPEAPAFAPSPVVGVGSVVADKYRVVRQIGQGGMGAVYEVEHVSLEARFAMKVLLSALASRPEFIERLAREAREAARIKHPGIVKVTDHGRLPDGAAYMVMELLDGQNLDTRIARGAVPVEETIAIARGALEALAIAHECGVIHRDIKPDNIFLCAGAGDAKVKILDFGIAKSSAGGQKLTADGSVLGTPLYMAPEQLASSGSVDASADVYSMGATLFTCLTGRPPVDAPDLRALLALVAQGRIERDVRVHRSDVPAWLASMIERALQADPRARFASAKEMLGALCATDSETLPAAGSASHPPRTSNETAPAAPLPQPGPTSNAKRGSSVQWLVLGGVALAGAVALVPYLAKDSEEKSAIASPSAAKPPAERPASSASAEPVAPSTAAAAPSSEPTTAPEGPKSPDGMVLITGRTFLMGMTESDVAAAEKSLCEGRPDAATCSKELRALLARSQPALEVTVRDVHLDRTEVSRDAFAAYLNRIHANGGLRFDPETAHVSDTSNRLITVVSEGQALHGTSIARNANGRYVALDNGELPVAAVTWLGAKMYCEAMGRRLPTEAEWELAARGPERTLYPWGNEAATCERAVYGRFTDPALWNLPKTLEAPCKGPSLVPVADADATAAGGGRILGLAGNVREWVLDHVIEQRPNVAQYPACAGATCTGYWVDAGGTVAVSPPETAGIGAANAFHAIRGGSFLDNAERTLSGARGYNTSFENQGSSNPHVGFRCAMSAK